jgi:hypothetical protein
VWAEDDWARLQQAIICYERDRRRQQVAAGTEAAEYAANGAEWREEAERATAERRRQADIDAAAEAAAVVPNLGASICTAATRMAALRDDMKREESLLVWWWP